MHFNKSKFLFFFCSLIQLFFLSSFSSIFANNLILNHEFENQEEINSWTKYGEVYLVDRGFLNLSSSQNTFPYLYNNLQDLKDKNLVLKVKFQYTKVGHWGTGFTFGNLMPQGYPSDPNQMASDNSNIVFFQIWQDSSSGKGLRLKYYHNEDATSPEFVILDRRANLEEHVLGFVKDGNSCRFYFDEALVLEKENCTRAPTFFSFGNPVFMPGSPKWSSFKIDYLKLETINEQASCPLVILPGLGASWNTQAIVYGADVASGDWQMTPFVNVYDRLVTTAEDNGYTLGENLFLWNYDWRQPVSEIASSFENFINETPELNDVEKIDLVGHSLGGLSARIWSQNFSFEKVNKLVTVGSPHKGAIQAYEALAGGRVAENHDLGWLGLQLLLQIHRNNFETNAKVLQSFAPVLNDLVPTFDFIKKRNRVIPTSRTSFKNDWLTQLNSAQDVLPYTDFLVGNTGKSTPEWLVVKNQSLLDQLLGLWPDGRLQGSLKGLGDGTVLEKSAFLEGGFDPELELSLSHRELVSNPEAVEKIFSLLGKEGVQVSGPDSFPEDDLLIFYLASPATLKVDNVSPARDNLQFVAIPHPEIRNYNVEIKGTGNGPYHLYLGQVFPSGTVWRVYYGETSPGEIDNYLFAINPNDPSIDPLVDQFGQNHFTQAREVLKSVQDQENSVELSKILVNLEGIIQLVGEEQWKRVIPLVKQSIDEMSVYRKGLSVEKLVVFNEIGEAMRLITFGWEKISSSQDTSTKRLAYQEYRLARGYYSLGSRLTRLSQRKGQESDLFKAMSLKEAEDLLVKIAENWRMKNYSLVEAWSYLAKTTALESFVQRVSAKRR